MDAGVYGAKLNGTSVGMAFAAAAAGAAGGAIGRQIDRQISLYRIQKRMDSALIEQRQDVVTFAEGLLEGEGVEVGAATYDDNMNQKENGKYMDAYGLTDPTTAKISIGPKCFNGDTGGASVLADTLVHENVHRSDFIRSHYPGDYFRKDRDDQRWFDARTDSEQRAYSRGQEFTTAWGGHANTERINLDQLRNIDNYRAGRSNKITWL